MVKNHLGSLSQDIELDHDTFKDIARSSTHTILAACGLEHKRSEVHTVPLPSTCTHIDRVDAGQTSERSEEDHGHKTATVVDFRSLGLLVYFGASFLSLSAHAHDNIHRSQVDAMTGT
ncbi:hypothetical protein NC651_029435 [Populus alba x Populus x berolinensis]|nr:hypothetical protein NC651_029435 [Populus alba x Populus x berolinensis]